MADEDQFEKEQMDKLNNGENSDEEPAGWGEPPAEDEKVQEGGIEVEIENKFYEADSIKNKDLDNAYKMFLEVVQMEKGKEIKYSFKALMNIGLICIARENDSKIPEVLTDLLALMPKVGPNEAEDGIKSLLDLVIY